MGGRGRLNTHHFIAAEANPEYSLYPLPVDFCQMRMGERRTPPPDQCRNGIGQFRPMMTICHRPVASGHEPVKDDELILLSSSLPARRGHSDFLRQACNRLQQLLPLFRRSPASGETLGLSGFSGTASPVILSVPQRLIHERERANRALCAYMAITQRSDLMVLSGGFSQASVMQEAADCVAELQRILGHRIVTRASEHCDLAAGNT